MRQGIGRAVVAVAVVAGIGTGTAIAHHGPAHVARYRQVDGPAWMPSRVVIRCSGWAEDSAARLVLVDLTADRAVYRCSTP